jgi:hypothetical protein
MYRVGLARTDVSEERIVSISRVKRINELGILAVTSNRRIQLLVTANVPSSFVCSTLKMEVIRYYETSVPTTPTWHHVPENDILQSHRPRNLKSYIALTGWAL